MSIVRADYYRAVAELGIKHRGDAAARVLMSAGVDATPAVRRGLRHSDPRVRARCCGILDHFMDQEAIPALLKNLDDPDAKVRLMAMHASACDRCKEGACRPAEADVVEVAMRLLAKDPDRHVRTQAAHALGPAVHVAPTRRRHSSSLTRGTPIRSCGRWRAGTAPVDRSLSGSRPVRCGEISVARSLPRNRSRSRGEADT